MLARLSPLPAEFGWAFELKLDGFRALVDTHERLRVVSRRGWEMTARVPELGGLPEALTLDGELVAWGSDELPSFPELCSRMLHGTRRWVALTYYVFDVLRLDGESVIGRRTRVPNHRVRLQRSKIARRTPTSDLGFGRRARL